MTNYDLLFTANGVVVIDRLRGRTAAAHPEEHFLPPKNSSAEQFLLLCVVLLLLLCVVLKTLRFAGHLCDALEFLHVVPRGLKKFLRWRHFVVTPLSINNCDPHKLVQ